MTARSDANFRSGLHFPGEVKTGSKISIVSGMSRHYESNKVSRVGKSEIHTKCQQKLRLQERMGWASI